MYWNYNINSSSELETLLAKEDVTLQEVLDTEDIISQCKAQMKNLIDFLLKPEMIDELVTLTTRVPSIELDECIRFKYPNIACELLTSDVPAINERLASDKALLDKLYSFLECEPPLNPLLASYFSRILGALITKKTEQNWLSYQLTCLQVLDFLKAKDTFITLLLKHIGTSAIMDLMLKLMTQVDNNEMRQNILNWLDSQNIIQSLVCLLNAKIDKERHYNVAQLLCDFIRVARDTQRNATERVDPDPLLKTLESTDTIILMLDNIFEDDKCESAIIGGIQVLLALLDNYQSSIPRINTEIPYNSTINDEAMDIENRERVVQSTTTALEGYLKKFHDLLINPPKKTPIRTSLGTLDPPLGNTRIQVAKLFAAIISTNNDKLVNAIIELGTFPVLLNLFFTYKWNNFLHTQVENCIVFGLKLHDLNENGENQNALSKHLLVDCNVVEQIFKAWKDNDEQQKEHKGIRRGYMGHLISLTNKIIELCSNTPLGQFFKDNMPDIAKSLDDFKENVLKDINAQQDALLGGCYPNTSNEDSEEYSDVAFPQDQVFTNYQNNFLNTLCLEYPGFSDDTTNDGDDTLQTIDNRTDTNFTVSDGNDLAQQRELFSQICARNINTLDDSDDHIFEDHDNSFQTVIEKEDQDDNNVYNSDDSDDDSSPIIKMDVDPWSSPKIVSSIPPIHDAEDPWAVSKQTDNATSDWADFSSATFEANFDNAFNNEHNDDDKKSNVEIKNVMEGDLKVESIEIDRKDEQIISKETTINDNSIDDVAQKSNDCSISIDDKKDITVEGDQFNMQDVGKPVTEPSNSSCLNENNNLVNQQNLASSTLKNV